MINGHCPQAPGQGLLGDSSKLQTVPMGCHYPAVATVLRGPCGPSTSSFSDLSKAVRNVYISVKSADF